MAKVVSFTNKKGGVGKTTTVVNMAAYCADFGKRMLLIDLDSQGNATTGLGFSKSALKKSVYNVLIDDEKAADNILKTEAEGLDLLPSNIDLAGAEVELVYKRSREKILKNAEVVVEDEVDFDKINVGCTVKVYDITYDEEMEFKIVGSTEANSLEGKISNESPVGQALIGKKVGETADVETQAGVIQYKVLEISRSK